MLLLFQFHDFITHKRSFFIVYVFGNHQNCRLTIKGAMPDRCVVPGCRSRGRFGFPPDPELRQRWVAAIRKESVRELARICDAHFRPCDIRSSSSTFYSAYQASKTSEVNLWTWHHKIFYRMGPVHSTSWSVGALYGELVIFLKSDVAWTGYWKLRRRLPIVLHLILIPTWSLTWFPTWFRLIQVQVDISTIRLPTWIRFPTWIRPPTWYQAKIRLKSG